MFSKLKKELKDINIQENIILPNDIIQWTKKLRKIKDKPFSFEKRDYLIPLYRDLSKTILIVKARQMEITEFALNFLLFHLTKTPQTIGLYMSDTEDHVSVFYKDRILAAINQSEPIRGLVQENSKSRISFTNGSILYLFSAWTDFEKARSIPVDFAVIDETQSINAGAIPILQEALSKSSHGRMLCIGTGSIEGDNWYQLWHRGDQKEWAQDSKAWIAKKPENHAHASSYRITQHMASWLDPNELHLKEQHYTPLQFANEVEGRWYGSAARPLLERDIRSLFDNTMALKTPDQVDCNLGKLYMGVDWGTGAHSYTVPWIWQCMDEKIPRYELVHTCLITETSTEKQADAIAKLIEDYDIERIVVDEAGGTRQVQKLADQFADKIMTCRYVQRPQKPLEPDRANSRILVDRTWVMDTIIDLIKRPYTTSSYTIPRIVIPHKTPKHVDWLVDHFICIEAESMTLAGGNQYTRYTHPQGSNDDALHACIYAYLASKVRPIKPVFMVGTMGGG